MLDRPTSSPAEPPTTDNVQDPTCDPSQRTADGTQAGATIDQPTPMAATQESTWDTGRRTTDGAQSEGTIDQPVATAADAGGTIDEVPPSPDMTVDEVPEPGAPARAAGGKRNFPTVAGYTIESELGRGGMGVVYKARQLKLKRRVALKMVLAGAHASRQQLDRFNQEAQAVARIQHPNIIQIHEIGEFDGLPYFSLEFVDGGTLAALIGGKPQVPRAAAAMVQTLAAAMQVAHDQNIIHRDLKPANILIAGRAEAGAGLVSDKTVATTTSSATLSAAGPVPKISDFGLAKGVEEGATQATQAGTIMGTPSYMAPEQARGDVAAMGPPCDQYSLGAILYELLTGRPPFQGATILETLDQVRNREPVPPTQLQPKVPIDLETICLKCLQKEPAKRYGACRELAVDLGRFLRGEPIVARPVSAAERAWRWCRRNPVVAGLTATAAALLVCIAAGLAVGVVQLRAKNKTIQTEKEAAIKAQGEAQKNEQDAIAARKLADTNAGIAQKNAADAIAASKLADKNAAEAAQQAALALVSLQGFIDTVQKRLDESPGTQQLKEEILMYALGELENISRAAEASTNTAIGSTRLNINFQLGNLYKQLGKSAAAMAKFRAGYQVAQERAELNQGSDASRFNLAYALWTLAEMDREINRDMQAALAHEKEALATLVDIAAHPKLNNEGKGQMPNKVFVPNATADMNRRIGVTYLRLGDIPQSATYFQTYLNIQRERLASVEQDPAAKPKDKRDFAANVAVALLGVGDTHFRLGDPMKARAAFDEALAILNAALKEDANSLASRHLLSGASMLIGDFHLRSGDSAAAGEMFLCAKAFLTKLVEDDPKKVVYKQDLSFAFYRLGQHALRTNDAAAANTHFQECLKIREQLAANDAINERRKMELMLVQAHCDDHAKAAALAASLEKTVKPDAEFLIDLGRTYAQCASAADADAALKAKYTADALRVLKAAVAGGYRDAVYLEREVDFDPIRSLAEYTTLLAEVRRRPR